MSNPKISVIIPVYNAEKYLERCIDSILAQTFTDFDLLLIDDGSKDKSGEICDEYARKDNRVKVFHKENGGVSSARNLGLDNANGEWVCFCDADDWVLSEWLQAFSQLISGNEDILFSGYISIYNGIKDKVYIENRYSSKKELVLSLGTEEIWGYIWCKCFKKSVIDKNNLRFNTNYSIWEDASFIYKFMKFANNFKITEATFYCYNKPDYTKKYLSSNKFDCCIEILQDIAEFMPDVKSSKLHKYYIDILCKSLMKYYKTSSCSIAFLKLEKYIQFISKCGFENNTYFKILIIKRFPRIAHLLLFLISLPYKVKNILSF